MYVVQVISFIVGLIGIAVIVWGVAIALVEIVRCEYNRMRGESSLIVREGIRHHLGSYLLLGLEFLIAGDIMRTIMDPSIQEVLTLAAIVGIRTVISYSLNREIAEDTGGSSAETRKDSSKPAQEDAGKPEHP